MRKVNGKSLPRYLKTSRVIIISFLGSLLGFASIATFFGISVDDKLNKDYYKSKKERLFVKK